MKHLTTLLLFIASLFMTACSEEESPLLFSVENISNPENVKIEYYSPDPSCVSKIYWIDANINASEITIKCTNANSIFIEDSGGNLSEKYICSRGLWKAEIVNSNTITFTIDEIKKDMVDESYSSCIGFNVVSQTKKGTARTGIYVKRFAEIPDIFFEL